MTMTFVRALEAVEWWQWGIVVIPAAAGVVTWWFQRIDARDRRDAEAWRRVSGAVKR